MAEYASIPIINGLTDYSHPCQAMADYMTIIEIKGKVAGLKVAYIDDGNNVAHSLMFAGAQLGAHVWVATPPDYEPKAKAPVQWAQKRGAETGGTCTITNDPVAAASAADVIYTDVSRNHRPGRAANRARLPRSTPRAARGTARRQSRRRYYTCSYNRTTRSTRSPPALSQAKSAQRARQVHGGLAPMGRPGSWCPRARSAGVPGLRRANLPSTRRKGRWGGYRPLLKTLQSLEGGFRY